MEDQDVYNHNMDDEDNNDDDCEDGDDVNEDGCNGMCWAATVLR